jgi:hypothetical protein
MVGRPWTDEDIDQLRRLAKTMPTAQIANELGRGKAGTIMKAHELRISLRLISKAGSRPSAHSPAEPEKQQSGI